MCLFQRLESPPSDLHTDRVPNVQLVHHRCTLQDSFQDLMPLERTALSGDVCLLSPPRCASHSAMCFRKREQRAGPFIACHECHTIRKVLVSLTTCVVFRIERPGNFLRTTPTINKLLSVSVCQPDHKPPLAGRQEHHSVSRPSVSDVTCRWSHNSPKHFCPLSYSQNANGVTA